MTMAMKNVKIHRVDCSWLNGFYIWIFPTESTQELDVIIFILEKNQSSELEAINQSSKYLCEVGL